MYIALSAPPTVGIPNFGDAIPGWLLGGLILVIPSVLLAARSHYILGHWLHFFRQGRRLSWWSIIGGSLTTAIAAFALFGALPAWDTKFSRWYEQATLTSADSQSLQWLNATQHDLERALYIAGFLVLIVGLAVLIMGTWNFSQTALVRRQPVAPKSTWMMSPATSSVLPEDNQFLS
jgi:hypothetical protein